jgi:glycosyltransferase involved in cell wall biosynthesis
LKIAFVNQPWTIAVSPRSSDSTGIWSYQVARRLNNSHSIIFYGCKSPDHKSNFTEAGINYRGISSTPDKFLKWLGTLEKKLKLNPNLPYFASYLHCLGYILQVAWDIHKQNCDIIHIHNFSHFVPIVRAFNPKAKIVLHMHCEWLSQLNHKAVAKRIAKADLVLSCSEYITNKIRTRFPQFASRCQTVYNGVDTNHFVPNYYQQTTEKKQPVLLFVGRVSPEKGIHLLIDAFKEIIKYYPQAQLKIAGPEIIIAKEFIVDLTDDPQVAALASFYPGSYLARLQAQIPPNLAKQIVFIGSLRPEELLQHYWDADLVINPSLSEAFGMSLVEAMACQIPVIGAQQGGMPEAIAEKITGLLFEGGNSDALASKILELLADKELRQLMGKVGRERVMNLFTWQRVAESLLKHYHNLYTFYQLEERFVLVILR